MGRCLGKQCQCLGCHSVHALVFIDTHPWDRMPRGETPYHHVALGFACLLPDATESISVGDADGIVATVLIELGPGGGLNCKHALVGCCVYCRAQGNQSRSLMFQCPHCPMAGPQDGNSDADSAARRAASRSRFSCSSTISAISLSLADEA